MPAKPLGICWHEDVKHTGVNSLHDVGVQQKLFAKDLVG